MDTLGRTLHVLQDFYSHSNYVDPFSVALEGGYPLLDDAARHTLDSMLLGGAATVPSALKLTLLDRNPSPFGNYEDKLGACAMVAGQYCHALWSKDSPGKNSVSTPSVNNAAHAEALRETVNCGLDVIQKAGPNWSKVVHFATPAAPAVTGK